MIRRTTEFTGLRGFSRRSGGMMGSASAAQRKDKNMSNEEDRREPHDIGRIAYEAAAAVTGCEHPWEQDNQDKWTAAARAVLAWACHQMEQEAEYGCPCNEDERLTWENADLLRGLGGLPRLDSETPNA